MYTQHTYTYIHTRTRRHTHTRTHAHTHTLTHSFILSLFTRLSVLAHKGYTADETDPEITRSLIQNGNVASCTFKTVDTSEVVATGLLLPATCCRTTDPVVCGGSMVVRQDFLSTGLGSLLMALCPEMAVCSGFDAQVGETHTKHAAVLHMSIKSGTIKLPNSGWGDTILIYKQFGRYVKASNI